MRRILFSSVLSVAPLLPAGGFAQEAHNFTVLDELAEPVTIVERKGDDPGRVVGP